MSVLLVDRSPLIEAGLRAVLRGSPLDVSTRVSDSAAAIDWLENNAVRLVVSDFVLDRGSVWDVARWCRGRSVPLVILATHEHAEFLARAERESAAGVITTETDEDELRAALVRAAEGQRLWSRADTRRLAASLVARRLAGEIEFPLTERELQVLRLAASGHSNRRIAERLDIAFETAKEHIKHILARLHTGDRTQAAVKAERARIL